MSQVNRKKVCSICKQEKQITEFGKDTSRKDGLKYQCKECVCAYSKKSYTKFKKRHVATGTKYAKNNKDRIRFNRFKRLYGITKEEYFKKLENQNNKCAICGCDLNDIVLTHIDHNHISGKVRDILCTYCNIGLGYFKENLNTLKNAIIYIEKHNNPDS